MAVSAQSPINRYVAAGGVTVFPYGFRVLQTSDLKVYLSGVLISTGYSVSGVDNPLGGNVTFSIAPAAGVRVTLIRQVPIDRTTDYTEGGALRADVLDSDFDRLVQMLQDIRADALTLTEFQSIADQINTDKNTTTAAAATAVTKALEAYDSAVAAAASQVAAAASAASALADKNTATTQAGIATTGGTTATTQAGIATAQAGIATTQATNASTSATTATTQATNASNSATAAAGSASAASTSAGAASTSASNAATSAADAATSAASLNTSNLVQLTGTQTVTGAKTFNDIAVTTEAVDTSTTKAASTAFADRFRSLKVISTGATTATTAARGALYDATGGITVPNAVFAAGDTFTIYNDTASNLTITQGASLTLRLVGTATTGNRTLAQRGLATVVFITASEAVISGGGLT